MGGDVCPGHFDRQKRCPAAEVKEEKTMGMDLARKDFGTTPEYFIAGATIRIAKAVGIWGRKCLLRLA